MTPGRLGDSMETGAQESTFKGGQAVPGFTINTSSRLSCRIVPERLQNGLLVLSCQSVSCGPESGLHIWVILRAPISSPWGACACGHQSSRCAANEPPPSVGGGAEAVEARNHVNLYQDDWGGEARHRPWWGENVSRARGLWGYGWIQYEEAEKV